MQLSMRLHLENEVNDLGTGDPGTGTGGTNRKYSEAGKGNVSKPSYDTVLKNMEPIQEKDNFTYE